MAAPTTPCRCPPLFSSLAPPSPTSPHGWPFAPKTAPKNCPHACPLSPPPCPPRCPQVCSHFLCLFFSRGFWGMSKNLVRWFEDGACCWRSLHFERPKQGDWNKLPKGSWGKNSYIYLYTSFLVKIKSKFDLSGLFEFVWVKACESKEFVKFEFLMFESKNSNVWVCWIFGLHCTKWVIFQKVQIFHEECFWANVVYKILVECWIGVICFLIFKHLFVVF